ncbi:magnetosome-associated protein MamJ-like [Battus philenor]|uniref:magnetosome-associated protein MamJ-like n=1 Tax=Battus philenor TaxID=42288 RepID=UPI0035D0CF18
MKLFIAFALFAVAAAGVLPPALVASDNPEIQEIIAAIQSPSTDPATAAALEHQLLEILGLFKPEPIQVGPAIVEEDSPISIGPAIIDFPLPDGGAVTEVQPEPVQPAPVAPAASAPLVQLILNVNAPNFPGSPVSVESNPQPAPSPVQVIEEAENLPEPIIVIDRPIVAEPVIVVENPAPQPVITLPDIIN